MPAKRRRLALDGNAAAASAHRVSLTTLPFEILAEILLHTCSPPTVLAVSRTSSFLYRSLQNPAASFIWRGVRHTCEPAPLPDPGDGWKKSEADYAAFVFGGGVCEVCRKATRVMYMSFAARIRLCGSWHCRKEFMGGSFLNVTSKLQGEDRKSLWVPHLESARCFYPSAVASVWPHTDAVYLRKSEWEEFEHDLHAYRAAEQAEAERKRAGAPTSLSSAEDERIMERCRAAIQRLPQIMEVSTRLIRWKWNYDQEYKLMKKWNEEWTKDLAEREGWNLNDLVMSQAYGSLQRRKTFLLERIGLDDVSHIRFEIESELLAMQARHKRQKAEATYKKKLTGVKKIYERLRCGTEPSGSSDPMVLPPLSVFCTLPSVRALKGSPDPNALPPKSTSDASDIKSPLAMSLITSDVHAWLVPVRKHLMTLLGYPDGWQSANMRALHPVKRVTARFFCRRCGEGKVGKGYQREQCLDFKGVCSHVCVARGKARGKSIEGRGQEAPQESEIEADTDDGNEQESGKSGRKKKSVKTLDWKVDLFENDKKAISLIKTILNMTGLSEESHIAATVLKTLGGTIRCMTCKGWIVMDFDTAIGHAHRHESMEIQPLLASAPRLDAGAPIPSARLGFERGTSELLLGPSYRARNLCKKVNYGCKHCLTVVGGHVLVGKGPRAMDFNALRSHAKAKHGIQDIGDEDFFCYSEIGYIRL